MFLVIIILVLIFIQELAAQIDRYRVLTETIVLVLTLASAITKLFFLCT